MTTAQIAVVIAGIALVESTVALLVVLLRGPKPTDTTVEGIDDLLDRAHPERRDLPTRPLPHTPRPGTVYTGRNGRKGPRKWLAHLGWANRGRHYRKIRRLP